MVSEEIPDMDVPPVDHGSDRYDYVEIQGPDDRRPSGPWFDELLSGACQDCRANVFFKWLYLTLDPSDRAAWRMTIAHDDGCPTVSRGRAEGEIGG